MINDPHDITPDLGEMLCCDKAVVSYLSPDRLLTNCLHCFQSTLTPLPCPTCSSVVFCSSSCRSFALYSYHKYECCLALPDLFQKEEKYEIGIKHGDSSLNISSKGLRGAGKRIIF